MYFVTPDVIQRLGEHLGMPLGMVRAKLQDQVAVVMSTTLGGLDHSGDPGAGGVRA
jgi:hypothetical protein